MKKILKIVKSEQTLDIYIDKDASTLNIFSELAQSLDYINKNLDEIYTSLDEKEDSENLKQAVSINLLNRNFQQFEKDIIKTLLKSASTSNILFENENVNLGLSNINTTYSKDLPISETKYIKRSLRSGMKEEFDGSIVLLGDLNFGAQLIASGNITIVGTLRGVAHAGADGNNNVFICANRTENTQVRIAAEVQQIGNYENCPYFYLDTEKNKIVAKYKEKKEYSAKYTDKSKK